ANAPRVLPPGLRGGGQRSERRLDHVLLQPPEWPVRLRERAPARDDPAAGLALRRLRAERLRRRARERHGGVAERRPRLRAVAGHVLLAAADRAGAGGLAGEPGD